MYRYLFNANSTAALDDTWRSKLIDALNTKHIASEFVSWNNEDDLAKKLTEISKTTTNTLVVIGNDLDFTTLIGLSSLISEEIAIGYIPLDHGRIAEKLHLDGWENAIEALAQRRIHETTVFSAGKRYFLDYIELSISPIDNFQPLLVVVDNRLTIRMPDCKMRFDNLCDDQYLGKTPILFSAKTIHQAEESNKDLLGGLRRKLRLSVKPKVLQIASLHGKHFHIESASEITDSAGRSYKNSLWVGRSSRKLRIITRRRKGSQDNL